MARSFNDILADVKKNPERYTVNYSPKTNHSREYENNYKAESFDELVKDVNRNPDKYKTNSKQTASIATDYANSKNSQVSRSAISSKTNAIAGGQSKFVPSNATKTEPLKPTNSTINEPKVVKSVNGSTAKTNVEEPKTTGEKVKDIAVLNASQYSDYRSAKAKMEAAEAYTKNYDAIKDYENFAEKRKSMSKDELELLDAIYAASHSNDTSNAEGRMREQLKSLGYTDDEITRYSIYNKRYNNQKDSELWRESAKEYADEHPYLSSASSILPSVFGGVMGIADKASQLSDIASLKESGITPTFDTNGKLNYASQYSDTIRNRFMETHNDWTVSAGDRDFDVGDFVYSTTMSGLDSVTAMLVGDVAGAGLSALGMGETAVSLGKLGDIDFGVGSNLLGLGAANQTFNDTIDKGGSMSQAITSATLAGIAETFFEGVSIGNLKTFSKLESMPVDSVKAFVKKSLGSAFTNATEEGLTEVANITSDYLINGGVSDFYISWQNYINAGYPEDEAKSLAIKDLVYRIAEAAAGGALMGLGFGIGGGAMNAAQNAISDSYTGKQISKNGNPSGLLENIKETATEKKLSELADKYAARIAEGKKVSNRQLGAIERRSVESTMNAEMDSASFDEILQGVSSNERNASQNREMAKIVQRYLDGKTVSKNEENIIKTDPTISDYIQSRESAESEFNDQKKVKALNTIMAGAVKEKESEIKSSGTENNVVSGKNAESIKIADIKRTGTNKGENVSITVEATVDGEKVSVPIEEVEFANSKAADVVNLVAGSTDLDTQTANYILKAAPMVKGSSATIIAHYMNYAYTAGRYNLSEDYIPTDATTILGKDIVEHLYKSGQNAKATLAESEIAKNVVKGKKVKNADVIRYEGKEMGVKRIEKDKTLTNVQKGSMIRGIALQKALGVEAVFYKSKKNADGKFVATIDGKEVVDAPNGMYKNGKIYIDVNAGSLGEGTMLFTMSHELTHFIKQWSPAQFRKLADYVLPIVHTDTDINRLIDNEIEKSKKTSNPLTREVAEEEIVANALETMLSDDKDTVINNLIGLKNEDEGLFKKIVSKISKWADEIHRFYNEMLENGRLTSAGRAVAEMADDIDGLRDMFTEALKDAGKNFQSATVTKISDTLEGAKDTDGSPLFQYRAMEADEAKYKQMLVEYGDLSVKQIDNLFNMVDEVIDKVKKNLEILDYDWERDIDDRGFEPVKPNSDSLYRVSVDFSTLCRKRILQQAIQIQLQSALDRAITREESIAIRDELMKIQQEGKEIEIACALCYVESARMKSPAQIQNFLDDRRTIIKEFFANKDGGDTKQKKIDAEMSARKRLSKEHAKEIANGSMTDPMSYTFTKSGSKTYASLKSLPASVAKEIRDAKKEAVKSYKPTAEEAKLLDVADNMSTSDFTSPAGLENLAKNYRRLFDAYTSYVRNATKSKGLEKDTWWRAGDSIEKIPDSLIDAMNKENGLRSQSWSDFQVIHTLDYIAAVIELSTRNAKMQAYTKVPDYVKLMGLTNEMINLSLIPVTRFNGSLEFDSVEGMDFEKALELRKKYHSTAGTICIGIKDKQIQMLLDSALIDYVIPYHQSGMSKVLRKAMHIPTWTSYESFQNDKKLDRKEAIANAKKYNAKLLSESDANYHKALNFSDWFDYNEANAIVKKYQDSELELTDYEKQMKKKYGKMFGGYIAMQEMANKYKTMCAERGLAPKFSYCNSSDAKTDFSQEENYWKLLIDRKMVDSVSGEIIEQKAVQPIFKQSDVLEILDDEIARYPKVSEDQNYATRVVVQKFLSGEMNSQIEAIEKVTGAVKKATDNLTKVSILNSVADSNGTLTDRNDAVAKSSNRGEETEFSDPTMEDNAKYSIREEPAPRKTIKGYKVFKVVNGKLYPPKVSNSLGVDTPVGVWLNADIGGLAVDENGEYDLNTLGRFQVKSIDIGNLAFRPGWHLGEYPDAKQFGNMNEDEWVERVDKKTNETTLVHPKNLFPYNFVWAECEVAADVDYQLDAISLGVTKKGGFNRTQAGLPYIPKDGYYKYRTNPDPETAPWLISGAIKVNRILTDEEVEKLCKEHGVTPQKRQGYIKKVGKNGRVSYKATKSAGSPIDLEEFGLKPGIVAPTTDVEKYMKTSESIDYESKVMEKLKTLEGYKKREINFSDPNIIDEFALNNQDASYYQDVSESSGKAYLNDENLFSDSRFSVEDNAKYSIRDTEYLELAKDPVKNEAKLNKMVKLAAKAGGFVEEAFHGSRRFGWTKPSVKNSRLGTALFVSDSYANAGEYAYSGWNEEGDGEARTIASARNYKPLEYDASTKEILNAIKSLKNNELGGKYNNAREVPASALIEANRDDIDEVIDSINKFTSYWSENTISKHLGKKDIIEDALQSNDIQKWEKLYNARSELYLYVDAYQVDSQWGDIVGKAISLAQKIVGGGIELENGNVVPVSEALKEYNDVAYADGKGVYRFYAKPGKQYVYNGAFNNFDSLKIPSEAAEWIKENYGDEKVTDTDTLAAWAKSQGYDSIKFYNIYDNVTSSSNDGAANVTAFFYPESQIKSADPVTYDDSGNIVPLSERFNEKNDDIRYSTRVDNATYFSGRGNGYDGYSMSNNARSAYEDGEMPLSKWTKTAIIEAVAEVNPDIDVSGLNLETLKKNFLTQSSWHHTSKYYNKTNFWSISSSVKSLTQEDINSIKNIKSTKAKRDATLDDLIDDTYRKIQVIKASGLYKSDNGVLHQLSNADKFDSIYEKAVEILRSDIDKKVSQWRSLPEGHWRKDDVTAYDADPEGFILSYYSGRDNLSKNSTLFKKIGEAVSKRFNEDNKDTRFSVRDSLNAPSDIYAFYNNKIDESREMTMILNNLGENYASMLGKVVPDDKQIRKLTSEIIKQYNSKIDAKYLNDRIRATFDYMANTNILDWSQDIIPYLGQIGKEVLEQSAEIDDSLYNADFRKWMKKTTLKVSDEDVSERYKTFNEMRKSFFGKVNLSQTKGIPIDSLWNDMVNASDGYLPVQGAEGKDRDGDVVAANSTQNMFRILDGYFENTKKKVVNPYTKGTYDIDAVSINIGLDLYRKYWDVARHETPESRFANQMNRGYAELKDAKQKLREEIERQKKEVISNSKKTLKREIQSYRDTRENTRRRQVSKNDIERKVRYLQTRYEQKTNAKHIPKKYDELVSMMLKALPFNAPSMGGVVINSGRIAEMCNTYRVVSEAKGSAIEDMVEENISNLNSVAKNIDNNQIPFSRLSLSDYEAIGAVVDHIKFLVDNENKLFGENKKETIDAVSTRIRNELYENSELLKSKGKRVARDKGSNFFSKMLKPEYLFEESGSETLYKQYVAIRNGENKQGEILYKFRKYAQEQKAKYSYDPRWKDRIINNGDGIKNDRGQVMNLTIEEAMSVYALSNRPQGLQHLLGGGIQIKREGKSTVPFKKITDTIDFRLTENDIQKIVNTLTSAQKQYADALVEYMSKDIAKDRNEVTMAIMGIEKYVENYYFPIESSKDAIADNVQRSERNSSVSNVGSSKTLNKNAMNKVIVNGFTDTVNNHIAESAVYCGFAVESENINRLWNSQTDDETKLLKSVIQENIGDARTRAMKQFMVDLNSGAAKANNLKFAEQFTSKMKKASVMANISVIVQQPTAVFRAMLYVDPKNFATTIHKADTEEMYRLNGCAMMKQIGYFDVNLGRTVTNWLDEYSVDKATKKDYSLAERWKQFNENGTLDELAGWGAEKADEVTWTLIWNACKKQCEGDLNKACELFQDTISKTQVYDSIFTKCELMRQKDLGSQMISAFMSEPVTSLNMLSKAIQDKSAGKVGGTVVARALTCYLGSLISNAMLKSLVQILRDDDDEKEFLVKYLTNIADNTAGDIFGMIPYLNSLYSILQGFSVERMDTEFFNAIVDGAKTIITEATSLTPDYEKMLSKALMGISQGVGIPVYNLYRDIKSIFVKGKKVLSGDKKTDNEKESPSNLPKEIAESIVDNFDFFNIGGKKINGKIKKYVAGDYSLRNEILDMADTSEITKSIGELYKGGRITQSTAKHALINLSYAKYEGDKNKRADSTIKGWDEKGKRKWKENVK